jgi:predicted ester cyclase
MPKLEANKELVRRAYETCINQRRPELASEFYADSYMGDIGGLLQVRGPVEYARMVAGVTLTAFPDVRETAERFLAEGESVVVQHRFTGTHSGVFLGIRPTGKSVSFQAVDIYRLADGKIVEEHSVADLLGLFQQLGVVDVNSLGARV